MAITRLKTISYRRAVWLADDGKDRNLEQLVKEAHAKLKKVSQRKFNRADGQYLKSIGHKPAIGGGYYIHIVAETPGDRASTVSQKQEDQDGFDLGSQPPPPGEEWFDGDVFAFLKGNDVCLCTTVLRDAAITTFCDHLFPKAGFPIETTQFELQKVAQASKLKMIDAQGVREIEIGATLYEASTQYIKRKNDAAGVLSVVGRHLNAIFQKDAKPKEDNINVSVMLKTDERMKTGTVLGSKRMHLLARDLIENNDDYIIVTRSGQRISPNEIFVREHIEIERDGKSVDRGKAWPALQDFHKRLIAAGIVAE